MRKMLVGALIVVASLFLLSAPSIMAQTPCTADFDCDLDVDAVDVDEFLSQFGREQYYNPCPDCYDSPCPCTAPGCDPPAPVEQTGQTTCYDSSGTPRSCAGTGEDGEYQSGVAWPNPRFTDNLDGTVTDNLTGLIWLKNANCFGQRTWNNALSDANELSSGFCGLTDGSSAGDWRLPNRKELFSLTHDGYYNPSIPDTAGTGQGEEGDPFNNVQTTSYWSSSTNANYTSSAWYVYMGYGLVHYYNKTNNDYVWPVRGGH